MSIQKWSIILNSSNEGGQNTGSQTRACPLVFQLKQVTEAALELKVTDAAGLSPCSDVHLSAYTDQMTHPPPEV